MNIEMTDLDMILNHLETTSLEPHDDYTSEITYKDQKILYKYIKNLQQENQQLKKQLEENQNPLKGIFAQVNDDTLLRDCGNMNAEIKELKNQQKEFIEYLEKTIIDSKAGSGQQYYYQQLLEMYKEIIGSDE